MSRVSLPLLALLVAGCQASEPPAPPPQVVDFRVHSDPGKPVPGAELLYDGKTVAATDASGLGQLKLNGKDGETVEITVVCPNGFTSPSQPTHVTLKHPADPAKNPEYTVACLPITRTVVIAVRAENGPNLPITYLGREIARTDASGAAHVLLKLQPGDQFDLTLATTDKDNESLRPQNPTKSFTVNQRDEVFTFDQKFEQEAKKRVVRRSRPRGPIKSSPDRR